MSNEITAEEIERDGAEGKKEEIHATSYDEGDARVKKRVKKKESVDLSRNVFKPSRRPVSSSSRSGSTDSNEALYRGVSHVRRVFHREEGLRTSSRASASISRSSSADKDSGRQGIQPDAVLSLNQYSQRGIKIEGRIKSNKSTTTTGSSEMNNDTKASARRSFDGTVSNNSKQSERINDREDSDLSTNNNKCPLKQISQLKKELSSHFEECGVALDDSAIKQPERSSKSKRSTRRRSFGDGAYLVPHTHDIDSYERRGGAFRPKSASVDRTAVGNLLIKREYQQATSIGAKSQDYVYDRDGRLQAVIIKGPPAPEIIPEKSVASPAVLKAETSADLLLALHSQRTRSARRQRAISGTAAGDETATTLTMTGSSTIKTPTRRSRSPQAQRPFSSSDGGRLNSSIMSPGSRYSSMSRPASAAAGYGDGATVATGSIRGASFGTAGTGRANPPRSARRGERYVLEEHREHRDRLQVVRNL